MIDAPNCFMNALHVLLENVGKETILKVTDWLRGIWEMRRRVSGPVQQWIDSIPSSAKSDIVTASECQERSQSHEHKLLTLTEPKDIPFSKDLKPPSMTISAPINVPNSSAMNTPLLPRYWGILMINKSFTTIDIKS